MESKSQIFFYGSDQSRISPKGQVTIPARFRNLLSNDELERGFALVQGQEACLYLYTHRQFGEIKDRAREHFTAIGKKDAFRTFMEEAVAVLLDPQGRFVLPGALREKAGLAGPDILFAGVDNRIEIWHPATRQVNRQRNNEADQWRREQGEKIFGL